MKNITIGTIVILSALTSNAFASSPEQQILEVSGHRRDYCPTDKKEASWGPAVGIPGAACILSPAMPVCVGAGLVAGMGYAIYDTFNISDRIKAEDAAKKTCAAAPTNLDADGKTLWSSVCEKLAFYANFMAVRDASERDNTHSVAPAPYGLNDSISAWVVNGKKVKNISAFMAAQFNLRSKNFPSCLSDPETVEKFASTQDITLRQGTDLMVENIRKYGVQAFQWASNRFSKYTAEDLRYQAAQFQELRKNGAITELKGVVNRDDEKSLAAHKAMLWAYIFSEPKFKRRKRQLTFTVKELDMVAETLLARPKN